MVVYITGKKLFSYLKTYFRKSTKKSRVNSTWCIFNECYGGGVHPGSHQLGLNPTKIAVLQSENRRKPL